MSTGNSPATSASPTSAPPTSASPTSASPASASPASSSALRAQPTRRRFLTSTATAAAITAVGIVAGQAGSRPTANAQSSDGPLGSSGTAPAPNDPAIANLPTVTEDHQVIVIGSGFGGGVAALRLAGAGVEVTVLERGRRWETGSNATTFPSPTNPDKRMLWHRSAPQLFGRNIAVDPYVGIIEAVSSPTMTALCPTGVGGGSLVYQGMSLQSSKEVFNATFPAGLDWDHMDRVHYPRVADTLGLEVCPDDILNHLNYKVARVFAQRCRDAGLTPEKIPMPIDWDYARRELRGEMTPSYTGGSGAMGVNNGGKHSVDVTYIAQAEATGDATVRTRTEVTDVQRQDDGTWLVHALHTDDAGRPQRRLALTAGSVVMAAGSVNTTRLLLRAKHTGTVPGLPDTLGPGWGSNGDRIYVWSDPTANFGKVQGGPVVYGTKQWDDPDHAHTIIQASIPGFGIDAMSTMMVGFGVSSTSGSFRWNSSTTTADLHWPAGGAGN